MSVFSEFLHKLERTYIVSGVVIYFACEGGKKFGFGAIFEKILTYFPFLNQVIGLGLLSQSRLYIYIYTKWCEKLTNLKFYVNMAKRDLVLKVQAI